jgi:polysaccharide deacetylase family protein (PEP-CTERM system associated)
VKPGGPTNAFTVDLEDWFQGVEIEPGRWHRFEPRLEAATMRLLSLLQEARVRATFFVLGHAAERTPELVRSIRAAGHEIGTHGYGHGFVYRLGAEGFAADLKRSLDLLGTLLGEPVSGHRAPFFSITRRSPWAYDVLRQHGIRYDSSVFPVRNYRYGIPDAPRGIHWAAPGLAEFPVCTLRLLRTNLPVAGGAYFRLFPYCVTRLALRRANAAGQPAAFYIHPWELDPGQPRLRLPRRIGLPHYRNLDATVTRLGRLLRDFRFAPMGDILAQRGWLGEQR